jgi:hypothetical protein
MNKILGFEESRKLLEDVKIGVRVFVLFKNGSLPI